ncbi:cytochrome c3 family protein [Thermodesulfobacterium hydrogeniphilum]|uniref:cytochrome c3 family protein n=1 Tax=Thermodesulfobacterium hydrogeniphilum TaxID=161156 RepID=UPI00056DE0F2|nr:cytochrome c3 family protein [Thermodesulfobacterium hydrogeniphilum]
MEKVKISLGIIVSLFLMILFNTQGICKVTGVCSNCHTMHNSQNNQPMVYGNSTIPIKALLRKNCLECHTGKNTGDNTIPYVLDTSEPGYTFGDASGRETLAGGNFYWVYKGNYRDGHNVAGLDPDDSLSSPPGFDSAYRNISWSGQQVTCAGTYGCHGDPSKTDPIEAVLGAHHKNELCNATLGNCDGSTVAKSYRFLLGVKGTEDPDWELHPDTLHHNGYYAVDNPTGGTENSGSINWLCGQCHGNFHSDNGGASPWLRHPTDYDMNNVKNKEYGNYPNIALFSGKLGVSATYDYFADVPVGNTQGVVLSQVLQNSGDAIVLCVSCHRAHGSPYWKSLRWDYKGWPGNGELNGCNACHTTKY